MTTENSVRVPERPDCPQCGGAGGWRWQEPDGSEAGDKCPSCDGFGYVAAPAPAVVKCDHNWIPDPDADGWSYCHRCDCSRSNKSLADAIPKPEQWAGLANAVYATVREALACDCNDTEDQVCDKCQALTAIIDLEERALARQQSRVVDHAMVERARQCIVMLRHHLGLFVQDDIALAMFKTAEEIETELRAALEGGRDGR